MAAVDCCLFKLLRTAFIDAHAFLPPLRVLHKISLHRIVLIRRSSRRSDLKLLSPTAKEFMRCVPSVCLCSSVCPDYSVGFGRHLLERSIAVGTRIT